MGRKTMGAHILFKLIELLKSFNFKNYENCSDTRIYQEYEDKFEFNQQSQMPQILTTTNVKVNRTMLSV